MTAFLAAAAQVGATGTACLANDAEIATKSPDYAQTRKSGTFLLPLHNHHVP